MQSDTSLLLIENILTTKIVLLHLDPYEEDAPLFQNIIISEDYVSVITQLT